MVAIRSDRLFESHKGAKAEQPLKICIKDAVHNMYVLIPLLEKMALDPSHPLPYLKIKLFRTKMNLIPQKDKVKLDAWTCKSLLSFVKMKTRKHLGSKNLDFLKMQRILDPNIKAGLDLDNDNSDVEEADLNLNLDEPNRVFDEDDHEVEEEDDAWFDQMIASSLSTDVVEDSQPLEPPPLGVQAAIAETQLDLPDLFNDSQVPDAFPKSPAADVRGRPVARPLAVIDLESPVVKEEVHANHCTPVAAVESAEVKSKRDYVAFLRKSVEKRVAQDLAEANALAASAGPMLVDDTLPLGGDNDSTLPMDVSTTMTTSVAAMLKRDDDSRLLDANIEDKSTAMPPKEMPEVLTRRVQLGLAADHKEESKQGKGRGKGRGRGRGKKTKTDAVDHEEVPAAPAAESSSKRGPPATPERRRLDFDVAASPDHHASDLAEKGTPPVRQEKKRVKATAKGKAAAKSAKAEQPAKHEPDTGNEPSTKETKKRARKGKKAGTEPAPEPAPSGQPKPVGEAVPHADPAPPEDAVVRGKKGPSERAIKGALKHLAEAKEDPASWLHVIKLWDVMDNMVHTKENPNLPKMQYWSYSMYWQSGRVGLLQKRVEFLGGDKPAKELKDVEDATVSAYKEALTDLVKAISIADTAGKSLKDF
ncbi:unnamed protein product [Durusdinium trenchii]|uniref:Uncharacterized protein n=1 Tax=Durusdinium trenchii TaxID=1381693 RepID=A0ABP0L2P1_9DINO